MPNEKKYIAYWSETIEYKSEVTLCVDTDEGETPGQVYYEMGEEDRLAALQKDVKELRVIDRDVEFCPAPRTKGEVSDEEKP